MNVVVSKTELTNLIGKIQNIVSNKPAIPILSNVLIEAKDDQLILSATDLTTSMRCFSEAKVIEEGAIALPAKKFFQLVRELISPQIKISTKNNCAEIISGSSIFKINGIDKKDFPTINDSLGNTQLSISPSDLKEMLSRTCFSAARDDDRYVLNGIYLKIENQNAKFIGTDGKRLAKINSQIDIDPSFQGSYIFPLKAVEEKIKILDENDKKATISLMYDKIFLETGNTMLMTKLLSGQYPDVERVIPTNPNISFHLHREELISLLRQISLFTSESNHSIKLIIQKGNLTLKAMNTEIGEGKVSMPIDYDKETLEIAFNPFFFLDILKHCKDETIKFLINDAYSPGVIKDSTSAVFVIMPMRIPENFVEKETSDDTSEAALT